MELELRGGRVEAQVPRGGCLVLRVVPGDGQQEAATNLPGAVANNKSGKHQALFLGFQGETERDLWLAWLTKVIITAMNEHIYTHSHRTHSLSTPLFSMPDKVGR